MTPSDQETMGFRASGSRVLGFMFLPGIDIASGF